MEKIAHMLMVQKNLEPQMIPSLLNQILDLARVLDNKTEPLATPKEWA
jgi:hypothetical protein